MSVDVCASTSNNSNDAADRHPQVSVTIDIAQSPSSSFKPVNRAKHTACQDKPQQPIPQAQQRDLLACDGQCLAHPTPAKPYHGNFTQLLQGHDGCCQNAISQTHFTTCHEQQQQPTASRQMHPESCKPCSAGVSQLVEKVKQRVLQNCEQQLLPECQLDDRPQPTDDVTCLPATLVRPRQHQLFELLLTQKHNSAQPGRKPRSAKSCFQKQSSGRSRREAAPAQSQKYNQLQQQPAVTCIADCTLEQAMQLLDLRDIVFTGVPMVSRHAAPSPTTPAASSWPNACQQQQHHSQPPYQHYPKCSAGLHNQHAYDQHTHIEEYVQAQPRLRYPPQHHSTSSSAAAGTCQIPQTGSHWPSSTAQRSALHVCHTICDGSYSAANRQADKASLAGSAPACVSHALTRDTPHQMGTSSMSAHAVAAAAESISSPQHAAPQLQLSRTLMGRPAHDGTTPDHVQLAANPNQPCAQTVPLSSTGPPVLAGSSNDSGLDMPIQLQNASTDHQATPTAPYTGDSSYVTPCMTVPATLTVDSSSAHASGQNCTGPATDNTFPATSMLQTDGSTNLQDAQLMAAHRTASLPAASLLMIPVSNAASSFSPAHLHRQASAKLTAPPQTALWHTEHESPRTPCTEQARLGGIIASASSVLAILNSTATCLLTSPAAVCAAKVHSEVSFFSFIASARWLPFCSSLAPDLAELLLPLQQHLLACMQPTLIHHAFKQC